MDNVVTVNPAYNNAVQFLDLVNTYLKQNNVTDTNGDTAKFTALAGSPAWLFALAIGSIDSEWQARLRNAMLSMDPANCTDDQVLNLASLMGLERGNGTPTYCTVSITNSTSASITIASSARFTDANANLTWGLSGATAVAANSTVQATMYCSIDGSYTIPDGTVFTDTAGALDLTITSTKCVEGTNDEPISNLRNRLITGEVGADPLIQAEHAIEQLSGISKCSIWFNTSTQDTLTLVGNVSLTPRHAFVCIKGTDLSGSLANTFYKYLNVPTDGSSVSGIKTENYTRGQSNISVYYKEATAVNVYVKLIVSVSGASNQYGEQLQELVASLFDDLDVGQQLTATLISDALKDNLPVGVTLNAVKVATTADTWLDYTTAVTVMQYPVLLADNVTVEEV